VNKDLMRRKITGTKLSASRLKSMTKPTCLKKH
jgi:hypothetical protein